MLCLFRCYFSVPSIKIRQSLCIYGNKRQIEHNFNSKHNGILFIHLLLTPWDDLMHIIVLNWIENLIRPHTNIHWYSYGSSTNIHQDATIYIFCGNTRQNSSTFLVDLLHDRISLQKQQSKYGISAKIKVKKNK